MQQRIIRLLAHVSGINVGTACQQHRIDMAQCLNQSLAVGIWRYQQRRTSGLENRSIVRLGHRSIAVTEIGRHSDDRTHASCRIRRMQSIILCMHVEFIFLHKFFIMPARALHISLQWHVALDTVVKDNHRFGTYNTRNILHTSVEKLHQMLIVMRIHLGKN